MREHNAGGPLYDLGVHVIDSLYWIMGNPAVKSVSGMTYLELGNKDEGLVTSLSESGAPVGTFTPRPYDYREFNVEDLATGYIRLENGATILLRTSWAVNMPENWGMAIAGTKAGLALPPLKIIENQGRYQSEVSLKVLANQNVPFPGHWRCVENFIGVLCGREEQLVKEAEVLNVIRTIEGLYRSAEEGREIVLDR
jgi:predicted dehydrogenase